MIWAVIVAGGSGERFGRPGGKQLSLLSGVPVVVRSIMAVERCSSVQGSVVVCAPDRVADFEAAVADAGASKVAAVVPGGDVRGASVRAGLARLPEGCDTVVVHDGARPLVGPDDIDAAVRALSDDADAAGCVLGHPAVDTVKLVHDGAVTSTPDRATVWMAHTPQVFRRDLLAKAHEAAVAEGIEGTDDASLVERIGGRVLMLEGPRYNVKITTPEDMAVAASLLAADEGGPS